MLFEDPLCPTCRSFHERLVDEGVFEKLDVTLVMFPLDSECNWMLDRSLHPGACVMAKAVLCGGDDKARAILEWAYDKQDELERGRETRHPGPAREDHRALGQRRDGVRRRARRWRRASTTTCTSPRTTTSRSRRRRCSSGDQRICDEDTDLGMKYTLAQLAPEVLP